LIVPLWDGSGPNCSKSCAFAQIGSFARCLASEIIVQSNGCSSSAKSTQGTYHVADVAQIAQNSLVLGATTALAAAAAPTDAAADGYYGHRLYGGYHDGYYGRRLYGGYGDGYGDYGGVPTGSPVIDGVAPRA